jgi:hypothetical protein
VPRIANTSKPVRKRRPPTQLIISEESKAALRARLDSEEGQQCLDEFARLIAEWATESMPTDLLQALGTDEGSNLLQELWSDIVNTFFSAHSSLAPCK